VTDPAHIPLPVDAGRYTVQDAAGTVRVAAVRWRHAVEGTDDLPAGVAVALSAMGDALSAAGGAGNDLGALARSVEAELTVLARRVGKATTLVDAVGPDHPLVGAVEAVDRLLAAAARLIALELAPAQRGTVAGLHVSAGGVPKTPIERAEVGPGGIAGDRQRERRHHGRASQALCLWSAEVIDALRSEGHPVDPGSTGENVTLSGIDWTALRPGVRLVLGRPDTAAVVELTGWTEPCSKIAHCFLGRDAGRVDHERNPGWSRAYAAVVRPGTVTPGEPAIALP
jgi:MOSC domain-containing protein YiiM